MNVYIFVGVLLFIIILMMLNKHYAIKHGGKPFVESQHAMKAVEDVSLVNDFYHLFEFLLIL